ncbi:MAG TPA: TadE family protein [Terriglobales bacterium]
MKFRRPTRFSNSRGQSLVETALVIPVLILIALNVVNLAYFFVVAINLTGASRTSTLYSIMGSSTPSAAQLPAPGGPSNLLSVSYLTYQDMTGALWNPTGATVQVCSPIIVSGGSGVSGTGTSQVANCSSCTSAGCSVVSGASVNPPVAADPEAPTFVLNQVSITYTFNTLIPGRIFNLPLQASPICNSGTCTLVQTAQMRAMN